MTIQQQEQVHTKDSLKVQALTQRIAQIVAQYEEQNADLRAEATLTIDDLNNRIQNLSNELQAAQTRVTELESPTEVAVDEVPQTPTEDK